MSFEKLLDDLEELKKSQSVGDDEKGDEKIQAAASGDGVSEDDDESEDENDTGEEMGKSMSVFDAEGNPVEAFDATDMVKSLMADITAIKAEREVEHEHLGKSLAMMHDLLKEQGETLKSLGEQVVRLSNEGRGRKAVVTVNSADITKSEPAAMTNDDLLAKCLTAQSAGRLTAMDVSIAETCINRGMAVPDNIRSRLS